MDQSDCLSEQMIREYHEEKPVAIVLSVIGALLAIAAFLIFLLTALL